jgi:hypothetical protein
MPRLPGFVPTWATCPADDSRRRSWIVTSAPKVAFVASSGRIRAPMRRSATLIRRKRCGEWSSEREASLLEDAQSRRSLFHLTIEERLSKHGAPAAAVICLFRVQYRKRPRWSISGRLLWPCCGASVASGVTSASVLAPFAFAALRLDISSSPDGSRLVARQATPSDVGSRS